MGGNLLGVDGLDIRDGSRFPVLESKGELDLGGRGVVSPGGELVPFGPVTGKGQAQQIVRGVAIEHWDQKLTREPGASAFLAPGNQVLLLGLLVAVVLLARWRRRLVEAPAAAVLVLVAAGALSGAGAVICYRASGGQRGVLETTYVALYEVALASLVGAGILATKAPCRGGSRLDLALLMAAGAFVRLWDLEGNPGWIHPEEVAVGVWTRHVAQGRVPELFATGYFDNPVLHFTIDALGMSWLGDTFWAYRLTSVPVGLLAAFFTYRIAAELFAGRLLPLLAGSVATFHHVLLYYGRNGIHIIDPALSATAAAYFALRGLTRGGWGSMLLSGVAAGVGVQGYFPTRIAALLPFAFAGAALLLPAGVPRREVGKGIAAAALGLAVALGPLVAYYLATPGSLASREEKVLAFTPGELLRGDAQAWAKVRRNLYLTASLHTLGHDSDLHYGARAPFVHPLLLPFVLLGVVAAGAAFRQRHGHALLIWAGLTLLLGSFIVNEPRIRRTFSVVPAFGLLVAAGVGWAAARPRWRRALPAMALLATTAASVADVDLVLRRYPKQRVTDLPSAAGRQAMAHPGETLRLMTLPDLGRGHRYLDLLAPQAPAADVRSSADLGPGPVLVSVNHAALLPALLAVPGARREAPWGLSPAWTDEDVMLGEDQTRAEPPLLVHLPEAPSGIVTITLLGDGNRQIERLERVLPFYDFRRRDHPGLREVVMDLDLVLDGGRRKLRLRALAREATAEILVDGVALGSAPIRGAAGGTHHVTCRFRLAGNGDSLVLIARPEDPAAPGAR